MSTINIPKRENVCIDHFPDNQRHARVNPEILRPGDSVNVVASLSSGSDVMDLLSVVQVLTWSEMELSQLFITYLYGARSDRQFQLGDSIELYVIANVINSLGFSKVKVLDPHSKSASSLIDNFVPARVFDHGERVPSEISRATGIIYPDKNARNHGWAWGLDSNDTSLLPVIEFSKERRPDGVSLTPPSGITIDPDRRYLVVDDICDGGATFIELANSLPQKPAELTLVVTHGIFSKGTRRLFDAGYTGIITTNSRVQTFYEQHRTKIQVIDILK